MHVWEVEKKFHHSILAFDELNKSYYFADF